VQQKNLILSTTADLQNAGLFNGLIPLFEKKTAYFMNAIADGFGQFFMF
jgi:ABC-type tungstate transport system permease subunit